MPLTENWWYAESEVDAQCQHVLVQVCIFNHGTHPWTSRETPWTWIWFLAFCPPAARSCIWSAMFQGPSQYHTVKIQQKTCQCKLNYAWNWQGSCNLSRGFWDYQPAQNQNQGRRQFQWLPIGVWRSMHLGQCQLLGQFQSPSGVNEGVGTDTLHPWLCCMWYLLNYWMLLPKPVIKKSM